MHLYSSCFIMDKEVNIKVCVIGAGSIGSNFVKEFGRFMEYYTDDVKEILLYVVDPADVKEDDLKTYPFHAYDIGFNKAACIRSVLTDTFSGLRNRKVVASDVRVEKAQDLSCLIKGTAYYSDSKRKELVYLIDTVGNKDTYNACSSFFDERSSVVWLSVANSGVEGTIECQIKANNMVIQGSEQPKNETREIKNLEVSSPIRFLNALEVSGNLFSMVSNGIGHGKMGISKVCYNTMQYYARDNVKCTDVLKTRYRKYDGANNIIVCVGTGGTGGALVKELARYLSNVDRKEKITVVLIDGDHVEYRNGSRQPFMQNDLQQNKAQAVADAMRECYDLTDEIVKVYPRYIDNEQQLQEAVELAKDYNMENRVYLVGAVDNHRARQVMFEYYEKQDDIIYVDSANEYSNGEVVFGIKEEGQEISPSRAFYFPDVLTDNSPSASELSCGVVNVSAPQHLATNLTAGRIILTFLIKAIEYGIQDTGIVYFDAFRNFSRFQKIVKEEDV